MVLSSAQRSFLVKDQVIGPIVINALLNGGLAWLALRHHAPVTMGGDPGIARDVLGTLFILPFLVALIANRLAKHGAQSKGLEPFRFGIEVPAWVRRLPSGRYARAALLGLVALVVLGPVLIGLLKALGVEAMSLGAFVVFKAVLAGALAGVVTPVSALYALGELASEQGARYGRTKVAPAE